MSGRRPFVIACAASRRDERPGQAKLPSRLKCAWPRDASTANTLPRAYELIDRSLTKLPGSDGSFAFEEHESGPKILVYLAVTTAGLSLAKSIIDLITAIIKARSEGIKKGDHPSEPLELIVRRVHDAQEFREETVLRIGHKDAVDEAKVEQQLKDACGSFLRMSLQLALSESSSDTGVLPPSFVFNKFPYRNRAALQSAGDFVSL